MGSIRLRMRQTFNASSCDPNLSLRFAGEVHSIFSKALNIRTEENELISIVAREKLNGPQRILLDSLSDDFISLGVKVGMRVIGNEQEIRIDGERLSISLKGVGRWLPVIKREEDISGSRIKDNLFFLKRSLLVKRKGDRISQALRVRTQELVKAIRKRNLTKVSKNVRRLIGCGEGLTPSGDDFLIGFIASLHFLGNLEAKHLLKELKRIIHLEKERTTFLSGKFLEYACQSRFSEIILNLIRTILSGNREEVEKATRRCLDFGATSGRDTLLGIIGGLDLIVQSR